MSLRQASDEFLPDQANSSKPLLKIMPPILNLLIS